MVFRFSVNAAEIAAKINQTADAIVPRLRQEVQALSAATHAFVVDKAQRDLKGGTLARFLGKNGENVRWVQIDPNIWVVEIDESVRDIEEGHDRRFMSWLLTNNPKAKTAKDGSKYAAIPMTKAQGTGPGKDAANAKNPAYTAMVKNTLKANKVSLTKIDRHADGSPKLGVIGKYDVDQPERSQFPGMWSAPRTAQQAAITGLPQHGGYFHLQGLVVTQRMQGKRVVREAVTFRTISSKHEKDGRWFQKAQQGLKSIPAAYDWAQQEWSKIVAEMEREFAGLP